MEDLQLKVENSPQISWHKIRQILSTKQKFYRLDNVVVTESLRKITISHQYSSTLDLIDQELGIDLAKIAKEFNTQIILVNQRGKEVAKYNPNERQYEPTEEDMKFLKSLKGKKYSANGKEEEHPFFAKVLPSELVEAAEELVKKTKEEFNDN